VYQAGTLSGNPVATACGLATLREVAQARVLRGAGGQDPLLVDGLAGAARQAGVPFCADSEGGMFGFFLLPELPQNYAQVMKTEGAKFGTSCSTACWIAACTSRRRCTKPASCRRRTARPTSPRRWQAAPRCSRRWG
jgi:glutamate-1-semialdehyde aminotransferase